VLGLLTCGAIRKIRTPDAYRAILSGANLKLFSERSRYMRTERRCERWVDVPDEKQVLVTGTGT
jgi:hypothetical protein